MRVGIPKESAAGETRVATVPDVVPKLVRAGLEVVVERGAGEACGYTDADYEAKGAQVADGKTVLGCEIVLAVHPPAPDRLQDSTVLLCTPDPLGSPETVRELAQRGLTCFAMELMPRISRAQSMDVLSSMANVAGYKAVLLAAARSPKLFPLMMTAAGTVRPARVFILAADDAEKPVLVHDGEVTGVEPTVFDRLLGGLRPFPIPLHDLGSAQQQLPLLANRHFGDPVVHVHNLGVGVRHRHADTSLLAGAVERVGVSHRRRLREPKPLGDPGPGERLESLHHIDG